MFKLEPLATRSAPAQAPSAATAPAAVASVPVVEAVRDAAARTLLAALASRPGARPAGASPESRPAPGRAGDDDPALAGRVAEVTAALRRETPRQGNPVRLLANLQWLVTRESDAAVARLPADARAAAARAWAAVPEAATLGTADGLVRALRASGPGLERALADTDGPGLQATLARDWKAALGTLAAALDADGRTAPPATDRTAPPSRHGALVAFGPEPASIATLADGDAMLDELAGAARAALARVTCTQLANLDAGAPALPALVEIPYRAADGPGLLRLRIDREPAGTPEGGPAWSVEFACDLGELGPLRGRVTLAGERVSVSLLPERGVLARAIDARVDTLRAGLERAGVVVGRLSCTRSDPVETCRTGSWLVDLRA